MKIVKRKTEYTVLELPEMALEVKIKQDDDDRWNFVARDLGSWNDNEWETTSVEALVDYLDEPSPAIVANLLRNLAALLSPSTKPRKSSKKR